MNWRNIRNIKQRCSYLSSSLKRCEKLATPFLLSIHLYAQVFLQYDWSTTLLKEVHSDLPSVHNSTRTRAEIPALYIPHVCVKTVGCLSHGSCCCEATSTSISPVLWPNLLHVFITGHNSNAAQLRLLNLIKCFTCAGPILK